MYRKKIFIDSNVILEAKPLEDLPWHEVDSEGPILILLVPTVLREVDSKKRDGRLSVRAREFNRLISPLVGNEQMICLHTEHPKVDIALAVCKKIDWTCYDDLDPNEGDGCVIAEILNVRDFLLEECVVISQDINPLFMARRHGLQTLHVPESWLAKAEPSPHEKELARLKRQVLDYSKNEPEFELDINIPENLCIYKIAPLSEEDNLALGKIILEKNPRARQNDNSLAMRSLGGYDYSYDKKYDKYKDSTVPEFARNLHKKLEISFGQVPLAVIVENIGKIRAEHLHIEVHVVGGWVNWNPVVAGGYPRAPKPEQFSPLRNLDFSRTLQTLQVNRHEVEVSNIDRSHNFTAQCADFRQGQQWKFDGVLWIDPHFEGPIKIIVEVTAANFHGKFERIKKIEKSVNDAKPFDLINFEDGRPKVDPYILPLVKKALQEERYGDIDWEK